MTVKRLKTIKYGKYYIAVAENNKQFEFAVFYNGKNDKSKIKSFFYPTLQEGEKCIYNDIDNLEKEKMTARQGNLPTKEEYIKCLNFLYKEKRDDNGKRYREITDNQEKMLVSHAKSDNRKMSAMELAKSCGYEDFETANKQYGDLGHKICDFLSYTPVEKNPSTDKSVWTFVIASGYYDENKHWYWIMHESLFEALKESNLLN